MSRIRIMGFWKTALNTSIESVYLTSESEPQAHGLKPVGKASNFSCIKNNSLLSTIRLNLRNVGDSKFTVHHTILVEMCLKPTGFSPLVVHF